MANGTGQSQRFYRKITVLLATPTAAASFIKNKSGHTGKIRQRTNKTEYGKLLGGKR